MHTKDDSRVIVKEHLLDNGKIKQNEEELIDQIISVKDGAIMAGKTNT